MSSRGDDWVPLNKRDHLSVWRLIGISLNQLTTNFIWTPTGQLMSPLFAKLGFSNTVSALVYVMGPISGLIISPVIGMLSDNTTLKFGRRRIYCIVGEVCAFVGLMLLAFCDKISKNKGGQTAICFIAYFVTCDGGNTVSMPGRTMVTDLTPDHQQVQSANIVTLQSGIAGIISNIFGAVQLPKYFNGAFGYEQFVLLLCTLLGFVALAINMFASPEEQLQEKVMHENFFVAIWKVFRMFNGNMLMMLCAHTFFAIGQNQWNAQIGPFFGYMIYDGIPSGGTPEQLKKYDDGVAFSQILMCIMTCCQIFFCFFSHHLTNRIGLKGTWLLGLLCGMVGTGLMNFVVKGNGKWFYLIPIVLYSYFLVTTGGIQISCISLYIDKEAMGCAQGILNFFNCIGQFVCIMIIQLFLGNFVSEQMAAGKRSFHNGNLIGISPIPLCVSLILGYIGISRTEDAHKDNLDNDSDGDREEVDDNQLKA